MDPLTATERLARLLADYGVYAGIALPTVGLVAMFFMYRAENRAHMATLREILPLASSLEKLLEHVDLVRVRRRRTSQPSLPVVPPEDS